MSWFLLAAGAAVLVWAAAGTGAPAWARVVRAVTGAALILYGLSGLLT